MESTSGRVEKDHSNDHATSLTSLHEALSNLTVDQLKERLQLLDSRAKSQRKADLIDVIQESLTGDSATREWHFLSQLEQAAVAEASHAPDLMHHEASVQAKYGGLPPFSKPSGGGKSISPWDRGVPTHLTLFLYPSRTPSGYQIPSDLAATLRKFVPRPADLEVVPIAAPIPADGLFVRLTEGDALAEVMALLRLAEQGHLGATAKTGMPTASGRREIYGCLSGGDFFPYEIAFPTKRESWQQLIGDIKPVGWIRFLQTANYLDSRKPKSKLTSAGIKALAKPPVEIIKHLWKTWLAKSTFDEFNRIEEIMGQKSKGHMTAKPPRREAIADALSECPPNEWVDLQKFSSFMQAEGFDFEVTRDPWKLYFCEQQYGSLGYDRYGGWDMIQLPYLQVFLFEYAATLGLIDLAYVHPKGALSNYSGLWGTDDLEWLSRYDGLRSFRITNLGAYCFGMENDFEPTKPESSLHISLSPDLTLHILSLPIQPADRLLLETWAEPITPDTWRLDPLRARDAIERGQSIVDFGNLLREADQNTLPETVEGFLKNVQRDATAVQSLGEATLYNCRDAATASMILENKSLKNLCHPCGETQLAVPAKNLAKFQKQVRALGLGIV
jgi:hypothetical protein